MKKIVFTFILFLLAIITSEAQKRKIVKIAAAINQKDSADAQEILNEYESKNGKDAAWCFFQARNNLLKSRSKILLRTSIELLKDGRQKYSSIDEKERNYYCKDLFFCENSADTLREVIVRYLWAEIKKDRNFEEVIQFQTDFSGQPDEKEVNNLKEELAFLRIEKSQTQEDFKQYLKEYPSSAYRGRAKEKLEETAFEEIKKSENPEDFRSYLTAYPDSRQKDRAQARLETCSFEKIRASDDPMIFRNFIQEFPNSAVQAAAQQRLEETSFQKIAASSNPEDYRQYLKTFTGSAREKEAHARLEETSYALAEQANSVEDYQQFIYSFPNAVQKEKAANRIMELEWENALKSTDAALLKSFLLKYPQSSHTDECKKLIAAREWQVLKSSDNIAELENWKSANTMYAQAAEAAERIKELKEFVLPYLNKNRKYHFYSVYEKRLDESEEYEGFLMMQNGNFMVKKNGVLGMAGKDGKIILPVLFNEITSIKDGYLCQQNGVYQIYNKKFEIVKSLKYKEIITSNYSEYSQLIVWDKINNSVKAGIIDHLGNEIVPVKYDYIKPLETAYLLYTKGKPLNLAVLVDEKGKTIMEKIENAEQSGNLLIFVKNDLHGIVNLSGKVILEPKFSSITISPSRQIIVTLTNGQKGIYDSLGNNLLDGKTFQTIHPLTQNIYAVGTGSELKLFDATSKNFISTGSFHECSLPNAGSDKLIICRKGNDVQIFDAVSKQLKDRAIVEDYSDFEDFNSGYAYDEINYDEIIEISKKSSDEFDETLKPSLNKEGMSVYLPTIYDETPYSKKVFNIIYSHAGNRIVLDAQSGKIKKIFQKIYEMNELASGFIEFRKNAEDEEYSLLDSNLNDTRFHYKSKFFERGNGELLVEISKNQKSVTVLYNQYSGTMEEIGADFTNVVKTQNYQKLSYKNIEYFKLRDGRTLFDKSIDFSEFDAQKILKLARDAQNNDLYQEAIRHYLSYLKTIGKNPEVCGYLADCYLKSDDSNQALYWINKAIVESNGFNENLYTIRISILKAKNSHRELAADYETMAENVSYNRFSYLRNAAYYHSEAGEHDVAINLLNEILPESNSKSSEDDDLAFSYNQRGNSYFSLGKYQSALLDFTNASKCVKNSNTEAKALYANNIGLTYLRMNNKDVACKYFLQACNLGKCDYMNYCR